MIDNCAKGGHEPAAEAGRGNKIEFVGQTHEVDVGIIDGHEFGERSPVGKARLELVIANLVLAPALMAVFWRSETEHVGEALPHAADHSTI